MSSRSLPVTLPDIMAPVDRWTPNRKQRLIDAVAAGEVDRDAALARHGISAEEFDRWADLSHHRGMHGLKATKRYSSLFGRGAQQ